MEIRSIYEQNVKNIPLADIDCVFVGSDHSFRIKKFINTFCYPRLYRLLVPAFVREQALGLKPLNKPFYIVWRILQKVFYFWPRPFVVMEWARGSEGRVRDPTDFQEIDSTTIQAMAIIGANIRSKDFSILDMGCNSGRHLAMLWQIGFRNLHGVDAMKEAFSHFSKIYPEVYSASKTYHDTFQDFLIRSAPHSFDVIFSWSATIELVHPSFDIVKNICRVARHQVILIINEGYPRFWIYEFKRNGFDLEFAMRPFGKGRKNTTKNTTSLCCFRRMETK